MKRFRLLIAAAVFGLVTTACSSDLVGPNPTEPSFDVTNPATNPDGPSGQGTFGSGG
jgi:hypothetical protein